MSLCPCSCLGGKRHLLGLVDPDAEEAECLEVFGGKSSMVAQLQPRLALAAAAAQGERAQNARDLSAQLLRHVCIFALLKLKAAHVPGASGVSSGHSAKVRQVVATLSETPWPASAGPAPGARIFAEAQEQCGRATPVAAAAVAEAKGSAPAASGCRPAKRGRAAAGADEEREGKRSK